MSKKSPKTKSRKEHDQMKRDNTGNNKSVSSNKPASSDKPVSSNKPASAHKSVSSSKPASTHKSVSSNKPSSTNKLVMSKDSIIEKCKKILKRDNS
jgi:hypothetical protein